MNETELALAAGRGDRAAFEALVRAHFAGARALAARIAGDDALGDEAAQTAFIKAFRALAAFRGEAAFRTWLYRIVVNEARGVGRESARRASLLSSAAERPGAGGGPSDDPSAAAEAVELNALVRRKIRDLPDQQREAIVLHLDHGMAYAEIAKVIGCSYEAVKVHISQARKRLKEDLREYIHG